MSDRRDRRERADERNDEIPGQGYEDTTGVDGHGIEGTVLDPRMGGQPVTVADVPPGPTAEPRPGTADADRIRQRPAPDLDADHPHPVDRRNFDAGKAYAGSDVNPAATGGPANMLGTPAPGSNALPFRRPEARAATNRPVQDADGELDIGGETDHNVNFPLPGERRGASGEAGSA